MGYGECLSHGLTSFYALKPQPRLLSTNISHIPPSEKLRIYSRIAFMELKAVHPPTRYAVVTGANRGIGLETVRRLANAGATVVLTARNEKRGIEATNLLHESGLSNVVFHQLDVQDAQSIESLAKFIATQFERLDILVRAMISTSITALKQYQPRINQRRTFLVRSIVFDDGVPQTHQDYLDLEISGLQFLQVNNAGASGVVVDEDGLRALNIDPATWLAGKAVNMVQDVMKTTYNTAKECIDTNYYGVKNVTEALLPLLQRSTLGARIVNVTSLRSELNRVPNEQRRKELGDIDTLTEEKIDRILQKFLHDVQQDAIEAHGWQKMLPAYSISKATLNAYTRILAKKYPNMCINCVHPGYVNTDLNWHTGTMTVQEGAEGPVMLALLPQGGPTGCYFDRTSVAEF